MYDQQTKLLAKAKTTHMVVRVLGVLHEIVLHLMRQPVEVMHDNVLKTLGIVRLIPTEVATVLHVWDTMLDVLTIAEQEHVLVLHS